MKHGTLIAAFAAAGALGFYLWRRSQAAAPAGRTASLSGDPSNGSLTGGYNLAGNVGYDLGSADRYDLSGTGQGSGFFTRQFQLSAMP